jgi:hypothetical protein
LTNGSRCYTVAATRLQLENPLSSHTRVNITQPTRKVGFVLTDRTERQSIFTVLVISPTQHEQRQPMPLIGLVS